MPLFQGCCAHDHDCEEADCGPAWSLHDHVDIPRVTCLNEAEAGSARSMFRPWAQRTQDPERPLQSNEDDPELLITIPFNGTVKIKAVCLIGGSNDGSAPAKVRAFVNRVALDFGSVADMPPTQQWDLQESGQADMEYPTQVAKFNGVHTLTLHIPENFGANHTTLTFIGIKGDLTENRRGAVTAVYEARALPSDHKTESDPHGMSKELM